MVLSNRRKFLLVTLCCCTVFQACGTTPGTVEKAIPSTPAVKSEFPFSTLEPKVYQADIILSDENYESRWFVARQNDNSRIDFFKGSDVVESKIWFEKQYLIDHVRRIYTIDEKPAGDGSRSDGDAAPALFRGREFRQFEEVDRSSGRINYRVRQDTPAAGEILISIDEATGIMVRQEFRPGPTDQSGAAPLIYEVLNLTTAVEDSVFAVPSDYRQVTREQYDSGRTIKNK